MRDIVREWRRAKAAGEPCALATVVHIEGSTYRNLGARMLLLGDGRRVGSISGGCLEADVHERGRRVLTTGEPEYVYYDSRSDADIFFGLGLGCNGAVGILIESLSDPRAGAGMAFLQSVCDTRSAGALATVYQVEGYCGSTLGERQFWTPENLPSSVAANREMGLLSSLLAEVRGGGRSLSKQVTMGQGTVRVLVEPVLPPLALVVFGAGQDAVPVTQFARALGWQIAIVDHRPGYATPERFPVADECLTLTPDCVDKILHPDDRTALLLMTHAYLDDRAMLPFLLRSPARYVGMLGPRRRSERMLDELRGQGVGFTADEMARLHNPVGLDIGAETPEEIALSVVAEIQAVFAGSKGYSLRERGGPIHETR